MRAWLLLVGDWHRAEFAAAQQLLASQRPVLCCPTVAAACRKLAKSQRTAELEPPAAIVLAQSWPGQIDHRQVDQLHALAPLARLAGLIGPWSEGPRRGEWTWPGVEVVPWHAWRWQLPAALGLNPFPEGELPPPVPKTATTQERIVHRLLASRHLDLGWQLVAVVSPDPLRAEGLAAMVRALKLDATCVPCRQRVPEGAGAVLVDGWQAAEWINPLEGPVAGGRFCAVPHFLLLPFPRWDDVVRAAAFGFAEVLAQPLELADLAAALAWHRKASAESEGSSPPPAPVRAV